MIESIYLPMGFVVRDCRALPIFSRSRLANRETALNSPGGEARNAEINRIPGRDRYRPILLRV